MYVLYVRLHARLTVAWRPMGIHEPTARGHVGMGRLGARGGYRWRGAIRGAEEGRLSCLCSWVLTMYVDCCRWVRCRVGMCCSGVGGVMDR